MHDQHRETDEPGEQRKGAQKTKESAGVDRSLELIEMKRQSEEEISEGHAEQERRHRPAEEQRPVPGVSPAGISDLIAVTESDRSQDERDQQHEHRQIQPREGRRIQQRPGGKHRAACEDEPHLVAIPHRLDRLEQRPPLLVGASHEAERGADTEIEPIHDRKADQERAEDQPPDHPERFIVGHGSLLSLWP